MDKYLLTDAEIDKYLDMRDPSKIRLRTTELLQAQLAPAEPLIRADVYREIGEWLETSKHPRRVSDYEIYLLKQGIKP